jgi:hypothetical protein
MKTNYQKAFEALKTVKSSEYNLSRGEGFGAMYRDMWLAICNAGINVTKPQALRAFQGPRDGYWTLMDMAEYLAQRCK